MPIYKRGNVWWTQFTVHGQRYQKSLETSNRRKASDEERKLIAQAEKGSLAAIVTDLARLTFAQALEIYLSDRQTSVSAKTKKPLAENTKATEKERAVILTARLGSFPVKKFTVDLLNAFIRERLKDVLRESFDAVWQTAKDHGTDLRTAAYMVAIRRVADSYATRGFYA